MSDWASLKERLRGKWQIPLLAVSVPMVVLALATFHRKGQQISVPDLLAQMDALIEGHAYEQAQFIGAPLLTHPEVLPADLPSIQVRMARACQGQAERRSYVAPSTAAVIVEHYRAAEAGEGLLTPADHAGLGRALEWTGDVAGAIAQWEIAIAAGAPNASDLKQHIINLTVDQVSVGDDEAAGMLAEFLGSVEPHRLDLRLWALERSIHLLDRLERYDEAAALLATHRQAFAESTLAAQFEFLDALLLYKRGQFDEAERLLRSIRNRVDIIDDSYAATGWLLGQVVLRDAAGEPQRPQEAATFFTDVIDYHGRGPYVTASRVGLAEALAMLARHDEAVQQYRLAIDELDEVGPSAMLSRSSLRAALAVQAEAQRAAGALEAALAYARLAVGLTDDLEPEQTGTLLQQLGRIQEQLAGRLEQDPTRQEEARAMYGEAGETFLQAAQAHALNEELSAEVMWVAADMHERAGALERAVDLFHGFARERPSHRLVPRALLRAGALWERMGSLHDAIELYKECYRRYPRTIDGGRALIPLADCYYRLGGAYDELAEKTLTIILQGSGMFTPEASEFADALFLLGDLLNRSGRYERAVSALEEALDRYPDDPREVRARYVLADSYRRSALALREELTEARAPEDVRRIRTQSESRLEQAAALYGWLVAHFEVRDVATLSPLEAMYRRHAYMCRADCAFELARYDEALKQYEEAAAALRDSPAALAAYVQVIHCHVYLGQPGEARAALARARVLADAMPEEGFAQSVYAESRSDWQQYFAWLADAGLF